MFSGLGRSQWPGQWTDLSLVGVLLACRLSALTSLYCTPYLSDYRGLWGRFGLGFDGWSDVAWGLNFVWPRTETSVLSA